nr:spore coat protein GerQ [Bacillus subtilis]
MKPKKNQYQQMQAFDNMQGYQPQFGANPYPQQGLRLPNAANDANAAGTARTTRTAGIWIPGTSSRAAVFKFHRYYTVSTGKSVPGMLPVEESYIENILRLNRGKTVPFI